MRILLAAALLAAGSAFALDENTLRLQLERDAATGGGRAEVIVGRLDPRLQLAPCAQVEPYLPPGTRLWGRTAIGLRCTRGASWNVKLPVEVRIFAEALVAVRPLGPGSTPGPGDYALQETEITREPPGVLNDPGQLRDRILVRAVAPGQALRADQFRVRPVVASGEPVRVLYQGQGFSVGTDGKALASAAAGASVRVQLESGRILSGTAREGRVVEIHGPR